MLCLLWPALSLCVKKPRVTTKNRVQEWAWVGFRVLRRVPGVEPSRLSLFHFELGFVSTTLFHRHRIDNHIRFAIWDKREIFLMTTTFVVNKSTRKRIAGISTKTPHFGVIGTQRNTHMAQKTNSDRKLRHPNFNRKLRHLKNLPSIGLSGLSAEIPQTLLKATIGDYRTCPQKSWNEY